MITKLKGGTNATAPGYTGPEGELVVNTDNRDILAHDGITLGGKSITNIPDIYNVQDPSLLSPMADESFSMAYLRLISQPFVGDGAHIESNWQIATDIGFTNPVMSLWNSADNLTELFVNSPGVFTEETEYFVRIMHHSSAAGWSNWSVPVRIVSGKALPDVEVQRLMASDAVTEQYFGTDIALSNDGLTIAVGAPKDDNQGINAGAVYIFRLVKGIWLEEAKIFMAGAIENSNFGWGIALNSDGNKLLATSYSYVGGASGEGIVIAYEYANGTWSESQRISASDAGAWDYFGMSISISADDLTAIISSHSDSTDTLGNHGSAYIFTWDGTQWVEEQKLIPDVLEANDQFGIDVDITDDGNTVIIGAHMDDTRGTDAGQVYLFRRELGVWSQIQRIEPGPLDDNMYYGHSVAISGDGEVIAIGLPYIDSAVVKSGVVAISLKNAGGTYDFHHSIWDTGPLAYDRFGESIDLSQDGSVLVVGAMYRDNGIDYRQGAIYIFKRDVNGDFIEEAIRQSSTGNGYDYEGDKVFISANGLMAITGAWGMSLLGSHTGAVYVYG